MENGKSHSRVANLRRPSRGVVVEVGKSHKLQADTKPVGPSARDLLNGGARMHHLHRGKTKSNQKSQEKQVSPVSAGNPSSTKNGGSMHHNEEHLAPIPFRRLGGYDKTKLRAIKFSDRDEADKAVELISKSPILESMQYLFADGLTMIVPEEAVRPLEDLKLQFKTSRVLKMSELDPAERAEIRLTQSL
jgi:hypothetical protein